MIPTYILVYPKGDYTEPSTEKLAAQFTQDAGMSKATSNGSSALGFSLRQVVTYILTLGRVVHGVFP